jgi:hypothetical protein
MVVVPFKGGRRLSPFLVPAESSGRPSERALQALRVKLSALGCEGAQGVGSGGGVVEIPLDAGT